MHACHGLIPFKPATPVSLPTSRSYLVVLLTAPNIRAHRRSVASKGPHVRNLTSTIA